MAVVLDRCSGLLLNGKPDRVWVSVLVPANGYVFKRASDDTSSDVKNSVTLVKTVTTGTATVDLARKPATREAPIDLRAVASGWWIPRAFKPLQPARRKGRDCPLPSFAASTAG